MQQKSFFRMTFNDGCKFCKMCDMFSGLKVHGFIQLMLFGTHTNLLVYGGKMLSQGPFMLPMVLNKRGILSPYLFRIYIREMVVAITTCNLKIWFNIGEMMLNLQNAMQII